MSVEHLWSEARAFWIGTLAVRLNKDGMGALLSALLDDSPLVLHGHDRPVWPMEPSDQLPVACEPFLYARMRCSGCEPMTAQDLTREWMTIQRDCQPQAGAATYWYDNTPRKEAFLCLAVLIKEILKER